MVRVKRVLCQFKTKATLLQEVAKRGGGGVTKRSEKKGDTEDDLHDSSWPLSRKERKGRQEIEKVEATERKVGHIFFVLLWVVVVVLQHFFLPFGRFVWWLVFYLFRSANQTRSPPPKKKGEEEAKNGGNSRR
jgi:hypothetical protein